jgi:hypothetical protein
MNNLASLDACPQAGSLLKASRVFALKLRQNGQATNCVNNAMQQKIGCFNCSLSQPINHKPTARHIAFRDIRVLELWSRAV